MPTSNYRARAVKSTLIEFNDSRSAVTPISLSYGWPSRTHVHVHVTTHRGDTQGEKGIGVALDLSSFAKVAPQRRLTRT